MSDVTRRYTDRELITLLRVLASDYNRRPTQRDILDDDRMPTHHTLIKRFGSIDDALVEAGLHGLGDSTLHGSTKAILEYYGLHVSGEYTHLGPLVVDFVIDNGDGTHYADVVEMPHTKIEGEISEMRAMLAGPYAEHYHQIKDIGDALKLTDILSHQKIIADISGEEPLIGGNKDDSLFGRSNRSSK